VTAAPDPSQPADSSSEARVLTGERRGVAFAFCWLFCILLGYFILRPVRETMGSLVGTEGLKQLFLAVFVVMLLLVPLYAALVARLPRRWIVRVVFHFFAACLPAFWLLMRTGDETIQAWTARVLFVWISVFGVFSTSVFWSVLADLFSSRQGRRLFGIIASGGTAGAIVGSLMTSQLAESLSTESLLLLPAVVIELGLWFAWRLDKQAAAIRLHDGATVQEAASEGDRIASGGLLAGITHVLGSSYLASICVFLFFVQGFGTLLYFQQAEIVSAAIPDKQARTSLFAYLDLGTQVLTLFIQLALSGMILRRLGVSVALVLLPIVYLIGFGALSMDASLGTLIATVIASRGVAYGITVPTREVLFTVVSREDKYKSKNFIDTVVLRGGDTISSYIVGSLRSAGVVFVELNVWALPLVATWFGLSWQLGRRQRKLAMRELPVPIPGEGEG
jgi:AAA family ATP:ADP antiporter